MTESTTFSWLSTLRHAFILFALGIPGCIGLKQDRLAPPDRHRPQLEREPIASAELTPITLASTSDFTFQKLASREILTPVSDVVFADADIPASPASWTLADFESMAISHNPTIQQLNLTTQKAAGYRHQVSLLPNPVIGYQAMQLVDKGTDQHTAFIDQEIVRGNKLQLNRRVLDQALQAQLHELEAQRIRVRTDVQIRFYQALEAQQRIELAKEFERVAAKGLELAELRKKALEGSQVEVLQAKVQLNQVQLSKQQADVEFAAAWRSLVAMAGQPDLPPARLSGDFANQVDSIDWDQLRSQLLGSSPEYQAAHARVAQARAFLQRQEAQAIPNLQAQLASGYDNGTDSQMVNLQFGAPIPIHNRNQGNIAAARADYCRALLEVQRVESSVLSRVANVSKEYDTALAAVQKYQAEILPSVRQTLDLAEKAYQAGEFSFLEVLVVRRTFFEANLQNIASLSRLWQAKSQADGYVLTGGLDPIVDQSGDASLRDQSFSQQ